MTKPKHILFLEELSTNGIGYTNNIIPFLLTHFPTPSPNMPWLWDREGRPAYLFINDLYYRNLIRFDGKEDGGTGYIPFMPHDPQAFAESVLLCYITSKGLDYLDSYSVSNINNELNKSYININKASLINYKTQVRLSIMTVMLAGASAYFSYSSNHKTDETAMSVERLRIEVQQWRIEAKKKPSQITYPEVQTRKP
jgi:hypothetical protein